MDSAEASLSPDEILSSCDILLQRPDSSDQSLKRLYALLLDYYEMLEITQTEIETEQLERISRTFEALDTRLGIH